MIKNGEIKFIEFVQRNFCILLVTFISIVALFIRTYYLDCVSLDMSECYLEWFNFTKTNGGLLSLGKVIEGCDYTQTYLTILAILSYIPNIKPLYLIKFVSFIFDFLVSIFAGKIVTLFIDDKSNKKILFCITYSIFLLLPSLIINSSNWGQCDSIYTAFVLISIYYLLQNKYLKSFIFYGIAFSFKLQSVLILPLYIIYYFKEKKFSILYFLIIPSVFIICCLPSIILGHSIFDCFGVYLFQITEYTSSMSLNIQNIYGIIPNFDGLPYICFGIFMLIMIILLINTCESKEQITQVQIIDLSLISVSTAVFLLPCMHDRYLFMADILSVIWFIVRRKNIFVPLIINFISFNSYCISSYGEGLFISQNVLSIMYLIVVVFLINHYFNEIKSVNAKEE